MGHTHKLEVVAQRIKDLIVANKVALTLDDVWYGDQDQLPTARTVCIEPVVVDRPMGGVPDMVQNNFNVAILVYVYRITEVQTLRSECNTLSEAVEDLLHTRLDLSDAAGTPGSDIIIHGWVTENLSGYTFKEGRQVRSSKLTWQGFSKTSLRFGP